MLYALKMKSCFGYLRAGISSKVGSSDASTCQGAREPKYTFDKGLIPGSSSRVPAGTMTALPLRDAHGRLEPHWLQKQVEKYFASGASNRFTNSRPEVHEICSGDTKRLDACIAPVTFLQREQWQLWKMPILPVSSKVTDPHKHFPWTTVSLIFDPLLFADSVKPNFSSCVNHQVPR